MVNVRRIIIYIEFALVVGVVVAGLVIRWQYSMVLSNMLFAAFGSALLGLAIDGDPKVKPTYFQLALQTFMSFASWIGTLLLIAQIAAILIFEGNLTYDENPISPLIYHQDFVLLIALLVLAIILTLIEFGRFIFHLCRKQVK